MRIRARLLLLASAMVLPYLFYGAYSARDLHQRVHAGALADADSEARRVAGLLETHVERISALLGAAEVAVGDPEQALAQGDARLRRLSAEAPESVSALAAFSNEGRILAATTWTPEERARISVADRDYFRGALRDRALSIGQPVQARGSGRWVVPVARPGAGVVLAASIELDSLDRMLWSRVARAGQTIVLATDRGRVITSVPGEAAVRGEALAPAPLARAARDGSSFSGEVELAGTRLLGASVAVPNAPWQVFVGVPHAVALQPAQAGLRDHLLVVGLMLLVAVPAAWWIGRGLAGPVLRLRRGVAALSRGNLSHRVDARTGGELGALATDVNRMAEKLGEAELRLKNLAALSSDFFWETDGEHKLTRLEGDFGKALGVPVEAAMGKAVWDLGLRVNGDLQAHLRTVEARESFRDLEFVRLDAERAIALVLIVSGEPRYDAAGAYLGYRGVARDVTEKNRLEAEVRRAQHSLARSEERFRSVAEMSSDWIWETDPEHRFTYISSGLDRTLDVSSADSIGRARWEGSFLNMDAEKWAAHRAMLERRERFADLRLERVNRSGRHTFQSVSGQPVYGLNGEFQGYRGVGRDITAQVEAELALRAEHARLARVLETMGEGLSMLDADGRYALVNASAERIMGARREDLLGRYFTDVPWERKPVDEGVEGGSWGTPETVFARMRDGELRHIGPERYRVAFPDGRERLLSHSVARLEDGAGGFGGLLVTFEDITDQVAAQKLHEQEILELNADLERRVQLRTAELTAAYKEMESFSYSVSHDLRAPLRAISGFSRILLEDFRGEFPAEAQRLLGRVAQNAERMGALIDGLLEFGRLSRQPLRMQRIRPAEVVREVLDELSVLREGRRVDIRVGDMPDCQADRILLKQVYANLVANAIKYTGLRPEARIEVGSITMGLGPVYYVRDNGTGFDMAYASKLFAMFERLHLNTEFEGNGVGLALVRRIVERHGGKVWADSAPDKGATFFFRLGAEAPAAQSGDGRAAA